jgi:YVTN family beta-propeller protein
MIQHALAKYATATTLALSALFAANAQSVKGTVNLSGAPEDVAVNFVTDRVYVAIPSFGGPNDTVAVIDGNSDSVIQSISIPPIGYQVAVDVVRDRVYVGGCFEDVNGISQCELGVIDGRRNKLLRTIPVTTTQGNGILGLAVNSIDGRVYVSNGSDNVVDVIDYDSACVSRSISLADETPGGIAVNPFTNQIYVAVNGDEVVVIDGRRNRITATTTVGTGNAGVAVNWLSGNVFVVNNVFGISTVAVLNRQGTLQTNVTVGNTPFGVDVDFITNLTFVTNLIDNTVSVIDGKTNTVTASLPVGGTFLAVNPSTHKVYVSGQSNQLTVLSEQ